MKLTKESVRNLQFIEADLRDYMNDPSDFTCEYIENVHELLKVVLTTTGIKLLQEEKQ
jgi:hypothetical protein